jgi:hypothetical protein
MSQGSHSEGDSPVAARLYGSLPKFIESCHHWVAERGMRFYDQPKKKRVRIIEEMTTRLSDGLARNDGTFIRNCASKADTHFRRWTYILIGRLYQERVDFRKQIINIANTLITDADCRVRQTAVYMAGEIGDLKHVAAILEKGLQDSHYAVRNGVIGALKVMGKRYPAPTLAFAKLHLHEKDPEVRRQIVHGIELRGRTHPEDILPLLRGMQRDTNNRVRNTIAHVVGQCSYKEGCLETTLKELSHWKDKELVWKAAESILEVHREQTYCYYTYVEAKRLVAKALGEYDGQVR